MESRWYVTGGKKLEDTKIEERVHALHVTQDNWGKITGHLDRNRLIAEAYEADEAKKRAMKEASDAMTKTWSNSIKNLLIKKEDQIKDKDNINQVYMELKKNQAEERKMYVEKMRYKMMQKKDYPAALNSALILSEVIYERSLQVKLEEQIKEHERNEILNEAQRIKQAAQDEIAENLEKKTSLLKKNRDAMELFKKQIHVNEENKKQELRERISAEAIDYKRAQEEIKHIEEVKTQEIIEKRKKLKQLLLDDLATKQEYADKLKKEDKEIDNVINIISKSKNNIACNMKFKKEDLKLKKENIVKEVAKQFLACQQSSAEKEQAILQKAMDESEALHVAKEKANEEKKVRLAKERKEEYERFENKQRNQKNIEKEIEKWELLNRLKSSEENAKYEEIERQHNLDKNVKHFIGLNEQLNENEKLRKEELEKSKKIHEYGLDKMKEEDDEFFKYAGEVYNHAKDRGRSTYPIEKVIGKYKKNILKEPPPERHCVHYVNCPKKGEHKYLNKTPGKLAHDPDTDPTYVRLQCGCDCHHEPLYKTK